MWMWSTGINRNIVECKAVFGNGQVFAYIVLIETLWNVKLINWIIANVVPGINRNIVECKDMD